jgi:ubiquinone/menaquinone biosynthesis C-methylase UbiE
MTEIHECPVCSGRNLLPDIQCIDHSVSHETFSLSKCQNCELLITTPRPSNIELDKYYVSAAYTSHIGKAKTIVDKLYLAARNYTLKWKLSLVKKNTQIHGKRLLDFGCGTGEFLKVAKSDGWQILGMEPSAHARRQSNTTVSNEIKSSLHEVINANVQFDAITLWHVLEHVEDLNITLSKLKDLLTKHGTIFIAVPNHTSRDAIHYGAYWAGYDVPRHLWHFGMKNMKLMADNHALTIHKIIPMRLDAYYISLLSEKYKNNNSFSLAGTLAAIVNALSSNYAARSNNEYSSLIYVLKK